MELTEYFNLLEDDITSLSIIQENIFDCILKNSSWVSFKWFILAKSKSWSAYTLCDVSFHKSDDNKFKPRLVFRRTNWELVDKKVGTASIYQRISFDKSEDWYNEFWEMIAFLHSFKNIVDIWTFNKEYTVVSTEDFISLLNQKTQIEKIDDITKILEESGLSKFDLEKLSENIIHEERKKSLEVFKLLLDSNKEGLWENYIETYKNKYELKNVWEEVAWHHFLAHNQWIIWLNLDLKFIEDFESEGNVWSIDSTWKWSPNVDLLGLSDYTTLIELKTANKHIFSKNKKSTSRTNTFSFSDDFMDWISQCLGQKSEWDKAHKTKNLIKNPGKDWEEIINQDIVRTLDSDCIFIIWNKEREFPTELLQSENIIKRDTFKRFRQNSKNVKIITFDELYYRAKNILN